MIFGFIKKCFFTAMTFINCNLSSYCNCNSLECVSINNQKCKIRTEIIDLNTNEPMFYPYSIKINRCKNRNKTIKWPKTCKCRCRLDASICNNKQRWNDDKCRCECKELITKGMCDKGFIWNPSNCECGENIDENEMFYNETLNAIPLNIYKKACNSCMVYIVLLYL